VDSTHSAPEGGGPGPTRIRRARAADNPALVDVWLRAEVARGVHRPPELVEFVRGRLGAVDALVLVAESYGRPVGLAVAEPAREDMGRGGAIPGLAHVGMVFTDPDHWGRGVGRALVDDLVNRLKAAGFTTAQLWVRAANERARRLYAGRGFYADGTTGTDDEGQLIIRMIREL
jgi:ribosomal protein S18 acetylase RimI-like enzyme